MRPDLPSDQALTPFGPGHVATLASLFAIGAALILVGRTGGVVADRQRIALGWLLLAQFPIEVILTWGWGEFSVEESVPIHLCDVLSVTGGLALLSRRPLLMDLTYFWGAAGSSQSLLTPVLMGAAFPHPGFIHFFASHGLNVIASLYVVLALRHRPGFASVWKALLWANVYAVATAALNAALGTNYAYLCHKPANATLLDLLGPWPWYLLGLEFVAALLFLILQAPFAILEARLRKD